MKEGWSSKELGEVTEIINGGTPKTKIKEFWDGSIAWITPADLGKLEDIYVNSTSRTITEMGLKKSSAKLFPKNSVILSTRAPIGHLAINTIQMSTNQGCRGIIPIDKVATKYLYYFLSANITQLNDLGTGTTFKELSTKNLASVKIPIPPLQEQKQIVSILDEAFAAIDQAKANIEKNIQNAEELFQSKLNQIFSQNGEGWEEKKLIDVCILQRGFDLPKRLRETGNHPLISSSGKLDFINEFKVKGPGVVTGRSGSIGSVFYVDEDFWPLNTTLYIKEFYDNLERYVYYLLIYFDLNKYASGTGVPTLNRNFVHNEIVLTTKDKIIQGQTVKTLDNLREIVDNLKYSLGSKVNSLEELKKSLLQKAFAGELTKDFVADELELKMAAEPNAAYNE